VRLSSAYSPLPTAYWLSKLILVIIVVQILFCDEIKFDGIESDNFQLHATLFTIDDFAFIYFDVDMDIAFTFGTRSGRHL
jgi:hypothetical protein